MPINLAGWESSTLIFSEGGAPSFIATNPLLYIDGVTSQRITNIRFELISASSGDLLSFNGRVSNITTAFTQSQTILTLNANNNASIGDLLSGIKMVQYSNSVTNYTVNLNKLINVSFSTNNGANYTLANSRAINYEVVNNPPSITGFANPVTFTERQSAQFIARNLSVTDIDNARIYSLQAKITNNLQAGSDLLFLSATSSVANAFFSRANAVYASQTGILTITSRDAANAFTISEATSLLEGIAFSNSSINPTNFLRSIEVSANDGAGVSPIRRIYVGVTPENSPPVIRNTQGFAIRQGGSVTLSQQNFSITDIDNTSNQIIVHLTSITGGTILVNKLPVAVVGNEKNSALFTLSDLIGGRVTFVQDGTGNAPSYFVQAANPDGTLSLEKNFVSATQFTRVNVAPNISYGLLDNSQTVYTEGGVGKYFVQSLNLIDPDNQYNGNATTKTMIFSIGSNFQANQDIISIAQIDAALRAKISVYFSSNALSITAKDDNAPPTYSEWETIAQNIYYSNSAINPNLGPRIINFKLNDGFSNSNILNYLINISATNSPPTLTGTLNQINYREGNLGTLVAPNISVYDNDSPNLNYAVVRISSGYTNGDVLFINGSTTKFWSEYDQRFGVLTIRSKGASALDFQNVLRQVSYKNTTESPTNTNRIINIVVNDGQYSAVINPFLAHPNNSNILSTTIAITENFQAPKIHGVDNLVNYYNPSITRGNAIANDFSLVDVDSPQLNNFIVRITSGYNSLTDLLTFSLSPTNITQTFDRANGVLTLTTNGIAYNAELNNAIKTIQFSTSESIFTKTFTFQAFDGGLYSNIITRTIGTVNNQPLTPAILGGGFNMNESATHVVTMGDLGLTFYPQNQNPNNEVVITNSVHGNFFDLTGNTIYFFTVADIVGGRVRFQTDGSRISPAFTYYIKGQNGARSQDVTQNIPLTLNPVRPTLSSNSNILIFQGESTTIDYNNFAINDPDTGNNQVMIAISSISNGYFTLASSVIVPNSAGVVLLTANDIFNGQLKFVNNGSSRTPSFYYAIRDNQFAYSPPTKAPITFVAYDQLPVISAPQITISEGQSKTLTNTISNFLIRDSDSVASNTIIQLSGISHGIIVINNQIAPTNGKDNDTAVFSLQQLNAGQVKFNHDGGILAPTFSISAYNLGAIQTTPTYSVAVNFTPVNNAPSIQQSSFYIQQGDRIRVNNDMFQISDIDNLDAEVVVLISQLSGGAFYKNNIKVTQFTLSDVKLGNIIFAQDGTQATPYFNYQARDALNAFSSKATPQINFNYVNQAPSFTKSILTISEGQKIVLNTGNIGVIDQDSPPNEVIMRIISVSGGQFYLNDNILNVGDHFTQAQLDRGNVAFEQIGGKNAPTFTLETANPDGRTSPQINFGGTGNNTIKFVIINSPPRVNDNIIMATASVGSPYRYTILPDAFIDPDANDKLTYSATLVGGEPLPSFLKLNTQTGQFSGTPAANDAGLYQITVIAYDKNRLYSYQNTTLSVAQVNQAPKINQTLGSLSILHSNFSYQIPGSAFSDTDNAQLSYSVTSAPNWLSFNSNGLITGTPPVNFSGSVRIGIIATDGQFNASQTLTLSLGANNQPRIIQSISAVSVFEDQPFSIQLPSGVFSDSDLLKYKISLRGGAPLPTFVRYNSLTNSLDGLANNAAVGSYTLTLTATDTSGVFNSQDFTFNVINTFDQPLISVKLTNQTVSQNAVFTYQIPPNYLKIVDKGQVFSYIATKSDGSALPSWLSFTSNDGLFTGIPGAVDVGSVTIRLSEIDQNGFSMAQNFTINVQGGNDPPLIISSISNFTILRNNYLDVNLDAQTVSDPQNQPLRYSLIQANGAALPSWLKFNATTLNVTGTPGASDIGLLWLKLVATDPIGASVANPFNIEITDINRAPTEVNLTNDIIFENQLSGTVVGILRVIDPDPATTLNGQISVTILENGSVSSNFFYQNFQLISLKPLNYEATPIIPITVQGVDQNGLGIAIYKTINIRIANLNDAPKLVQSAADQVFAQYESFSYTLPALEFTDEDAGNSLTYQYLINSGSGFTQFPSWLKINSATRAIYDNFVTEEQVGSYTIRVIASDNAGLQTFDDHILTLDNVNDTPSFTGPLLFDTAYQDFSYVYSVPIRFFTDPDKDDRLTYSLVGLDADNRFVSLPDWLTYNSNSLILSGTPGNEDVTYNRAEKIAIIASDQGGLTVSAVLNLQVNNVNDDVVSVASYSTIGLVQGQAFNININSSNSHFSDPDLQYGDALRFTGFLRGNNGALSSLPSWISLTANGFLEGRPTNAEVTTDARAPYSIVIQAADKFSKTANLPLTISVANVNDAPTAATIGILRIFEESLTTFNLGACYTEIDYGDSLTYTAQYLDRFGNAVSLPSWIIFQSNTNVFTISAPHSLAQGTVNIQNTAYDQSMASASQIFTILVASVNHAPFLANSITSLSAKEGDLFTFNVAGGYFSDIDVNDRLRYSLTLNGLQIPNFLTFDPINNILSGTPTLADSGTYTFNLKATDNGNLSATTTFKIVVDTRYHPPMAGPIASQIAIEDMPTIISFPSDTFTDIDGRAIVSYQAGLLSSNGVAGLPNWLVFGNKNQILLSGTPGNFDTGLITIQLGATDSGGFTGYQSFSLFISNTNDAPSVLSPIVNLSAVELQQFSFTVPSNAFYDQDPGDILTFNFDNLPTWLSYNPNNRTLTGTASRANAQQLSASDFYTYSLTITARDQEGQAASQPIYLTLKRANNPPNSITISNLSINENLLASTVIGSIVVSDPDTISISDGQTIVKILENGAVSTNFSAIMTNTNNFTLISLKSFNRESRDLYSVTLVAIDQLGAGKSYTQNFTININNVDEGPPIFTGYSLANGTTNNAYATSFLEGQLTTTLVLKALSTDPDNDPTAYFLPSMTIASQPLLADNTADNSYFTINPQTGELFFKTTPKYGARTPSYRVIIGAQTPANEASYQTYVVNVLNDHKALPLFINLNSVTVAEGTPTNTSFFTLQATNEDFDSISYSLVSGWTDNNFFALSGTQLFFLQTPYYRDRAQYDVRVVATSSGGSTIGDLIVNVNNLNLNSITFVSPSSVMINENTPVSTIVYQAIATEPGVTAIGYSLADSGVYNDNSYFTLNNGLLRFISTPIYQTKSIYQIAIDAYDGANLTRKNVQVNINRVLNPVPSFTTANIASIVDMSSGVFFTVQATDSYSDRPIYKINSDLGDASLFTINSTTGVLSINTATNYVNKRSYTIEVDAIVRTISVAQIISVVVNPIPGPPAFTSKNSFSFAELSQNTVFTAMATDIDYPNSITYYLPSITSNDNALFTINSVTGAVRFISAPEYLSAHSPDYNIIIGAQDPTFSATQNVAIRVVPIGLYAPSFTSSLSDFSLSERTYEFFTANAIDLQGFSVAYSLDNNSYDNRLFTINSVTGVFTNISFLDATDPIQTVEVTARSNSQTARMRYTINVNHLGVVNFVSGTTRSLSVDENSSQAFYTAIATEVLNFPISYTINSSSLDAGAFNINSATGVLRFVSGADYETKSVYLLQINATSKGNTAVQTLTISINNLLEGYPSLTNSLAFSVNEDTPAAHDIFQLTGTDRDNFPLSYFLPAGVADNNLFTIVSNTGVIRFRSVTEYTADKHDFLINALVTASGAIGSQTYVLSSQIKTISVTLNNLFNDTPIFTTTSAVTYDENYLDSPVITVGATIKDGSPIIYSLNTNSFDGDKFRINSLTGDLTLISAADFETQSSYTVQVFADGDGNRGIQLIRVAINNIKEFVPLFISQETQSITERNSGPITVLAVDKDFFAINYSLLNMDDGSLATITPNGKIYLNNPAVYRTKQNYVFDVVATAGQTSSIQRLSVAVTPLDTSVPIFTTPSNAAVLENYTGYVIALNATDPDGPGLIPVTYSITTEFDGASFAINSLTGALSLTQAGDFESSKTSLFVRVVAYSQISSASEIFSLSILNQVESAPGIVSPSIATVGENFNGVFFTVQATDFDKLPIVYNLQPSAVVADNQFFSINSTTGALSIISAANFEGKNTYSIAVTAVAGGLLDTKNILVNISNVIESPPSFTSPNSFVFLESYVGSVAQLTSTDIEGESVTYAITADFDAASFTINSLTGVVSINQSATYLSPKKLYFLNVRAITDNCETETMLSLFVSYAQPYVPNFTSSASEIHINENASGSFYTATASIADGAPIVFSLNDLLNDNRFFTINSNTGALKPKNPFNYEIDKHDLRVQITATANNQISNQIISVSVDNIDESATSFVGANLVSVSELNSLVFYTAQAIDGDLVSVVYQLPNDNPTTDNNLFTIDSGTGALKFISAPSYITDKHDYFITIAARGDGALVFQNVHIVLTSLDLAYPSFASLTESTSVVENSTDVFFTALAQSPYPVDIYYILPSGVKENDLFTINSLTGTLRFKAPHDYETESRLYGITIIASTSTGKIQTQNVTVSLTDADDNSPSFINSNQISLAENYSGVLFTATALDADGTAAFNSIAYSIDTTYGQANLFSISSLSGIVTALSPVDFETFKPQPLSIRVIATSANNKSDSRIYTINLQNIIESPPIFLSPSTVMVSENTLSNFYTAMASSPDLLPINYSLMGNDANYFTINSSTGALRFIANPDYESNDPHLYNVILVATHGSVSANFNLAVSLVNVDEFPTSYTGASVATVLENDSGVFYFAAASDGDNVPINYALVAGPSGVLDNGFFDLNSETGALNFKQGHDFETEKTIYYVTIGAKADGSYTLQTVSIDLINVDEFLPSIITPNMLTYAENGSGVIALRATDLDKNAVITYALVGSGFDNNSFTLNSLTGDLSFKNPPNFESKAEYIINLLVNSSEKTETKIISIAITDNGSMTIVNFPSMTYNFSISEKLSQSFLFNVMASSNLDRIVSYAIDNPDFTIDNSGNVAGILNYQIHSSVSLQISATDRDLGMGTTTVNIDILPIDHGPPSFVNAPSLVNFAENGNSVVIRLSATEPDRQDTIIFSLTNQFDNNLFRIDSQTGDLQFKSAPNFESPQNANHNNIYQLRVLAIGNGNSDSRALSFSVAVTNIDEGGPSFTNTQLNVQVDANASIGTNLYTATAIDIDSLTDSVTYFLPNGFADNSLFTINSITGIVKLNSALGWQSLGQSLDLTIGALANGVSQTTSVTVEVAALFFLEPIFSVATVIESFNENSGPFAFQANASATEGRPDDITYSLGNTPDAQYFTINSTTGLLTANSQFNYESKSQYSVLINAYTSNAVGASQELTVNVLNINEGGPSITNAQLSSMVNENTTNSIFQITANDPDFLTDTISFTINSSYVDGALFSVNANTGQVYFKSPPNYERNSAAGGNNNYVFQVIATSKGQTDTEVISISVQNINDTNLSFTNPINAFSVNQLVPTTTTLFNVSAVDPDGLHSVSYYLTAESDDNYFTIDSQTGAVHLLNLASYTVKNHYTLKIYATKSGFTNSQFYTLSILNTDTAPPRFTNISNNFSVNEGITTNTVIYTASAVDPDQTQVSYTLVNNQDYNYFSISSLSGQIRFITSPNYDNKSNFVLNVRALSGNSYSDQTLNIAINPLHTSPSFVSLTNFSFAENLAGVIGNVSVAQARNYLPLTYSLGGADASLFSLSALGQLSVKTAHDYETERRNYSLVISVSNGYGTIFQSITAALLNIDEGSPTLTSSTLSFNLNENTALSFTTSVTNNEGTLTYALMGAPSQFTINSLSGTVSTSGLNYDQLIYINNPSPSFVVAVTNSSNHTVYESVTINLMNIKEGNRITSINGASTTYYVEDTNFSSFTGTNTTNIVRFYDGDNIINLTQNNKFTQIHQIDLGSSTHDNFLIITSATLGQMGVSAITVTGNSNDYVFAPDLGTSITINGAMSRTAQDILVDNSATNDIDILSFRYHSDPFSATHSGAFSVVGFSAGTDYFYFIDDNDRINNLSDFSQSFLGGSISAEIDQNQLILHFNSSTSR